MITKDPISIFCVILWREYLLARINLKKISDIYKNFLKNQIGKLKLSSKIRNLQYGYNFKHIQ